MRCLRVGVVVLSLVLGLFAGGLPTAAASPAETAATVRPYLVLGDSLSAGYVPCRV